MKQWFRLVLKNSYGYGLQQQSLKIGQSSHYLYPKNETHVCCTERAFCRLWLKIMENIISTDRWWYLVSIANMNILKTTTSYIHSPFEKSLIIERTIQYIKDRIKSFDDYFSCKKENCNLEHVKKWLNLFVNTLNKNIINA